MLGIILLYNLGKYFYDLALEFDKSKWKYTIFGIIIYFVGQILAGFSMAIIDILFGTQITSLPSFVVNIIALPFGIFAAWLYYNYLQNKWSKKINIINDETILDEEII